MLKKILSGALVFFIACLLISIGVHYLLAIKWVLLTLAAIIIAMVIGFRIRRNGKF
jgi:4-hydroxybenzoate polyprenyltransferase